jgi:hypothetical protein
MKDPVRFAEACGDAMEALAVLQMFPAEKGARKQISKLLYRMVETEEQLDWLVGTMVDRVGVWHGPAELRGVYCTKYKPADGLEGICILSPGFTGADCEAAAAQRAPKELSRAEAQRLLDGLKDEPTN